MGHVLVLYLFWIPVPVWEEWKVRNSVCFVFGEWCITALVGPWG